ncbi:MAG: hypothetical protein IJ229_05995 [Clostridia bacterium]|nr:hypothetical protein [Clostridia bacterium]
MSVESPDRTQILREMRRERARLNRRTLRRSVLVILALSMLFGYLSFRMRYLLVRVDGPGMGMTIPSGSVVLIRRITGDTASKGDIVLVRQSDEYLLRRIAYVSGETVGEDEVQETDIPEGVLHVSVFGDPGRSLATQDLHPTPEPEVVPEHAVYLTAETGDMGTDSRSFGSIDTGEILGIYVDMLWPPERVRDLKGDVVGILTDW